MVISRDFLAGLVAAEGCFSLQPNNAATSWRCAFSLCLRDDDRELLTAVADYAGCGRLYAAPARSTSHPQIVWRVQTMRGCRRLRELLDEPLWISKKAEQFGIWRDALDIWCSRSPDRFDSMALLAEKLHESRDPRRDSSLPVDISHPSFEGFLAGFVTGEGHFSVGDSGSPVFTINLRGDDKRTLDVLAIGTGVGDVVRVPPPNETTNARASWRVNRRDEQRELAEVLATQPPLGRKGRSYGIWRELVLLRRATRRRWSGEAKCRRTELSSRLRASLRYEASDWSPARPSRSEVSREVVIAALRRWSSARGHPYSACAYEAFRSECEPDAPTRNTAARVFGSWRAALEAAGVSTDDALPADRVAAIAGAREAREVRRAERRDAIVVAIGACAADLGRAPRAMEFFRWRLAHAPESPGQADVYRLFDGGYPAALAVALDARGQASS